MFDNFREAAASPAGDVAQLCAVYDPLLTDPAAALGDVEAAELSALANIFDLAADRPPAEVWRDLRPVLVRQAVDDAPARPVEPLTILVAEDDADTAADLVEALTEAGHHVVGPFHNAEAALVSAGLHRLDLALLDINLSGQGSGVELARRLDRSWGVPAVFLSGDVTQAARHADAAAALVLKPYSARQVLNAVAAVAGVKRVTQPRPDPAI